MAEASAVLPAACSRSPQTTQAWATASRRGPAWLAASAPASCVPASGVPIEPSAAAAAAATSASAFVSRGTSIATAPMSRRTPSELIAPIRSLPVSVAAALRSAASDSGPGIASSAIRAHDESRSFASSGAWSGTAAAVPYTARCLQVIAFSASAASDRSTASSAGSLGVAGGCAKAACVEASRRTTIAAAVRCRWMDIGRTPGK